MSVVLCVLFYNHSITKLFAFCKPFCSRFSHFSSLLYTSGISVKKQGLFCSLYIQKANYSI